MNQRAKSLAKRLRTFIDDVIGFVEGCSDKNWRNVLATEEKWTVGVTARHIGAGHFDAIGLAKMIAWLPSFLFVPTTKITRGKAVVCIH